MVVSLEDALAIFNKWKEESTHIVVAAESPFRQTLSEVEGQGLRWAMSQRVRVCSVLFRADTKQGIVDFAGPDGNLSLAMAGCRFSYEDPREASADFREEAETLTVSALGVLFPYDHAFFSTKWRSLGLAKVQCARRSKLSKELSSSTLLRNI